MTKPNSIEERLDRQAPAVFIMPAVLIVLFFSIFPLIVSLFVALSQDAVVNSKKNLKYLVKESQTPKGLNEQGVKELRKAGFYRSSEKTLNSILKRLNKV